jgi:hypothetical protein
MTFYYLLYITICSFTSHNPILLFNEMLKLVTNMNEYIRFLYVFLYCQIPYQNSVFLQYLLLNKETTLILYLQKPLLRNNH